MARDMVRPNQRMSGARMPRVRGDGMPRTPLARCKPAVLNATRPVNAIGDIRNPRASNVNFRSRIPVPIPQPLRPSGSYPTTIAHAGGEAQIPGSTADGTHMDLTSTHHRGPSLMFFEPGKIQASKHDHDHDSTHFPDSSLPASEGNPISSTFDIPPRRSEAHPLHHRFDELKLLTSEGEAIFGGRRRLRQQTLVAQNRARHLNNLSKIAAEVEDILLAGKAASKRQEVG